MEECGWRYIVLKHYWTTWDEKEKTELSMLINLCERNRPVITNTWFRKAKRTMYNCKAPEDQSQHQVDYRLVKH